MRRLHAIIPAGGTGTRLWPLSRADHPKFFLDLLGEGRSLLQATVERLLPISETITIVTGSRHEDQVKAQISDSRVRVLVEPSPRDSMAAIGLAVYRLAEEFGDDCIVGSFAADHVIEDEQEFVAAVNNAIEGAAQNYLTTIGITPAEPSTAFGYIEPGSEIAPSVYAAQRFVEKPEKDVAEEYCRNGFLWNAGMFVMRAGLLREGLAQMLPQMDRGLAKLSSGPVDAAAWNTLPRIAIDYALAEPMAAQGRVAVTPGNCGWSDIGDFKALADIAGVEGTGVFTRSKKHVVTVGLSDVAVIDTDDALLVIDLHQAQKVKQVVDHLKETGQDHLL
ncbi:NTP transferase domain-containing protein [Actinomycetaceae bacterium WB03_NA08]|uniref:NTP transferase domain-containing protein n=1 Tax=Scrofimicrobium canadense TaxID=2652290 RepID=A0A6N7VPS0_9ACTO|nr:mannose-1-phosphate guanylyltransferase [Scrofimicrobium canadense]MSS83744.1 NTP transferase domain-containing protein [Scrofimicrobium canadense]